METLKIADKDLLTAYTNAVRLKLDEDFIQLLEAEIKIRGIIFIDNLTNSSNLVETTISSI